MNKKFSFGFLALLALASCSSDEPAKGGNEGSNEGTTNYLTVNVVATPTYGPRAADDQVTGDPDGAKYEEGTADENAVSSVRFYFFDENNNAAMVKKQADGTFVNYHDWIPQDKDNAGANMPNVEKRLAATLVISTKEGDGLPAKIAAVINGTSAELGTTSLSLAQLKEVTNNYRKLANENKFVMFNSAYASDAKAEVVATAIPESSFQKTEAAALLQPVYMYVERCVAKVRVTLGSEITLTNGLIALKDKEGKEIEVDGNQVYLKLGKWNLTATTNKSYLVKKINPAWNVFTEWSYAPYFRSFWATNCDNAGQEYFSFAADGIEGDYAINEGAEIGGTLYCEENAANDFATGAERTQPTKVIMGGMLCDANGKAIELYKWLGQTVAGDNAVITAMLKYLQESESLWIKKDDNTFAQPEVSDFKIVTGLSLNDNLATEAVGGRYLSYLQLSDSGKEKVWTASDAQDAEELDVTELDKNLVNMLGGAQVWKSGFTYYYFPIEHFGTETARYGVVRNHIYDATISSIAGLGTPVYDPNEVIYPEKPEDETYIAAAINILSWRVVPQNIELNW